MARVEYRKEFFDRTYTAREAYSRLWKYARRYRFRIVCGIVCGMLTAGTLLPLFQVIQPAVAKVSENEVTAALKEELAAEPQQPTVAANRTIGQSNNRTIPFWATSIPASARTSAIRRDISRP